MLAVGWVKPLWRWFQRNRASTWPTVSSQIESVTVSEAKRSFFSTSPRGSSPSYVAELGYSYSTAGNVEAGFYKREFGTEGEASEFARDLKGKPVVVHYNPNKPSASTLSEASIETLLQTRAPKPAWELTAPSLSDAVPEWLQPFVWVFVGLSAVGFVLSLWVHFGAVAGGRVAPAPFFWILHMGIFVVWFPSVMVAQRQVGNLNRKDFWKVIRLQPGATKVRTLRPWSGVVFPDTGWCSISLRSPFYIQQHAKLSNPGDASTGIQFRQVRTSALVVASQ